MFPLFFDVFDFFFKIFFKKESKKPKLVLIFKIFCRLKLKKSQKCKKKLITKKVKNFNFSILSKCKERKFLKKLLREKAKAFFQLIQFKNKEAALKFDEYRIKLLNFEKENKLKDCLFVFSDKKALIKNKFVQRESNLTKIVEFSEKHSCFITSKKHLKFFCLYQFFNPIYLWILKNFDFFEEKFNLGDFESFCFHTKKLLYSTLTEEEKQSISLKEDEFSLFLNKLFFHTSQNCETFFEENSNLNISRKRERDRYFAKIAANKILFDISNENFAKSFFSLFEGNEREKILESMTKNCFSIKTSENSFFEFHWTIIVEDFLFDYCYHLFFNNSEKTKKGKKKLIQKLWQETKLVVSRPNVGLTNFFSEILNETEKLFSFKIKENLLNKNFTNINKILYKDVNFDCFFLLNNFAELYDKKWAIFKNEKNLFYCSNVGKRYRDPYYLKHYNKTKIFNKGNFFFIFKKDSGALICFSLKKDFCFVVSKNNIFYNDLLADVFDEEKNKNLISKLSSDELECLFFPNLPFEEEKNTIENNNLYFLNSLNVLVENPLQKISTKQIQNIDQIFLDMSYFSSNFDLDNFLSLNKSLFDKNFSFVLTNLNPVFLENKRLKKLLFKRKISLLLVSLSEKKDLENLVKQMETLCKQYCCLVSEKLKNFVQKETTFNSLKNTIVPKLNMKNLSVNEFAQLFFALLDKSFNIVVENVDKNKTTLLSLNSLFNEKKPTLPFDLFTNNKIYPSRVAVLLNFPLSPSEEENAKLLKTILFDKFFIQNNASPLKKQLTTGRKLVC